MGPACSTFLGQVPLIHSTHARLALAIAAALITTAPVAAQQVSAAPQLVFTGVTVVDVRQGRLSRDQTVVVDGERIVAVGPRGSRRIPASARIVDASGRFMIPGLWDMHVHSAAAAAREFPLHLAMGVTGVRNMHTTADSALAMMAGLRRSLRAGTMLGPRLVANGPIVDGPRPAQRGSVAVGTAAAGARAVDSLVDGGADFIKVRFLLSRDAYFAIARQARQRKVAVAGHVPIGVHIEEAADSGQRSFEHSDVMDWNCSTKGDSIRSAFLAEPRPSFAIYRVARAALTDSWSGAQCASSIAAVVRNRAWVVPTLVVAWGPVWPDSVLGDSSAAKVVPRSMLTTWRVADSSTSAAGRRQAMAEVKTGVELVRLLRAAGVPLMAGTDVGNPFVVPGYSLHTELALLVRAGLSPLEALQSATLNPARFLGATDSLGTVEPGRLADLLLLDANPLADIRNTVRIRAVVTNGRYLDRPTLDRVLARAGAQASEP